MEKIIVLWKLLFSRTYVVALDSNAYISLPIHNIQNIDNALIVAGQSAALKDIRDTINTLIKEHDKRIKEISVEE